MEGRVYAPQSWGFRKYDIYNKGVPKTPQAADDVADRIIDAAGETRRINLFVVQGLIAYRPLGWLIRIYRNIYRQIAAQGGCKILWEQFADTF